MKDNTIFGIGIFAILLIAALIIGGNNQCNDDEAIASEATTDMLLQQKNISIAKLIKLIKVKDAALVTARTQLVSAERKLDTNTAELEGAREKISTIRNIANSPIEAKAVSKK